VLRNWNQTLDYPARDVPILIKIHGAVQVRDRSGNRRSSYLISETDYLKYLNINSPESLAALAFRVNPCASHFLFLGYGLRDWHIRLLLYRLQGSEVFGRDSWAVQKDLSRIEPCLWTPRRLKLIEMDLAAFGREFRASIENILGTQADP